MKASLSSSEREKRVRFDHDRIPGGAIRKARPKEVLRDEKVMQALAASMRGGAIRNTRKKEAKRDKKIDQALAAKRGGRIKFHDKSHEYLYKKLSGRGGRLDSPQCRKMMFHIMDRYDPSLFQSYLAGKVKDTPRFEHDHPITTPRPKQDARADVIHSGGSLNRITHSENGFLRSHDPEFHSFLEVV